jgi:hypothetical protein
MSAVGQKADIAEFHFNVHKVPIADIIAAVHVDPVANETGWISMAYLEPTDAIENTPQLPKSAELKTPKPTLKKMAKLRTSKPRHIHPTYAQLPADREFVPPRRGGLFGLFLSRRF